MNMTDAETSARISMRARCTTITSGYFAGEAGEGYSWLGPGEELCDNISLTTRGHYQGSEAETVLYVPEGCKVAENQGGTYSLFSDRPLTDKHGQVWNGEGLSARDALYRGIANLESIR